MLNDRGMIGMKCMINDKATIQIITIIDRYAHAHIAFTKQRWKIK